MSKADDIFYRQFGLILLALVLFTVTVFIIARAIGTNTFARMKNSPQAVLERIEPLGRARVGKPEAVVAAAAPAATTAAAAGGGQSGEQIYNGVCTACHAAGVAGAPKTGDKAAWEPRLAQGMDALVSSSIKGKGTMPPKGGNMSLSDADIKSAVAYMLQKAGLSDTGASAQAPAPAPAAATTASTGQAGEAIYNKACVVCHAAGVAGAPKLGDKAAWAPRLAQGMDTLVSSSIKGKGAMPPKGGNMSLSDADVKSAVQYMLEKSGLQPG